MKYKETHPKKVRGGAVHKTQSEKMAELAIKEAQLQVTMLMEGPEPVVWINGDESVTRLFW